MSAPPPPPPPPPGLAKFIGRKVSNRLGGSVDEIDTYIGIVSNVINIVQNFQSSNRSKISSRNKTKANVVNNVVFIFANIEYVVIFLIVLFCDYMHDLDGGINTLSKQLGIVPPKQNKLYTIFFAWVNHVVWLEEPVKSQVVRLLTENEVAKNLTFNMLTHIFRASQKPDETRARDVLLAYMKSKGHGIPFSKVRIDSQEFLQLLGTPSVDISFDQTSKASAPIFYYSSKQHVRNDVSLPLIADKGLDQPSNPFADLINSFESIADLLFTNVDYSTGNDRPQVVQKFIEVIARDYVLNTSETFSIQFQLRVGPKPTDVVNFMGYTYEYASDGTPSVKFNNMVSYKILSAQELKSLKDPSYGIYKTGADLGIIAYGVSAHSISVTGDRAAYLSSMFLTFLNSMGQLEPRRLFRSIFELSPKEVIVNNDVAWVKRHLPASAGNSLNADASKINLAEPPPFRQYKKEKTYTRGILNTLSGSRTQSMWMNTDYTPGSLQPAMQAVTRMNVGNGQRYQVLASGPGHFTVGVVPKNTLATAMRTQLNNSTIQKILGKYDNTSQRYKNLVKYIGGPEVRVNIDNLKKHANNSPNNFAALFLNALGRNLRRRGATKNQINYILGNASGNARLRSLLLSGNENYKKEYFGNPSNKNNIIVRRLFADLQEQYKDVPPEQLQRALVDAMQNSDFADVITDYPGALRGYFEGRMNRNTIIQHKKAANRQKGIR
jgi:hypothetical protein